MAKIQFKMYVDNKPAARELLDRVEEITVEQEVDMAWEARIQIPFCLDEKGKWLGESEKFKKPFSRMRVEVSAGNNSSVPLIDGPVVGFDSQMSFEPGQSTITLIVKDDSVFLNREEQIKPFQNKSSHEIAKEIFEAFKIETHDTTIEKTSEPANILRTDEVQRGTAMQFLTALAKCHVDKNKNKRMHAFVLPGQNAGKSIGAFKSFPTKPDGLPDLKLIGPDRNIKTFNVKNDAETPANVNAVTLNFTGSGFISGTASFLDHKLLGDKPAITEKKEASSRILGPYRCILEDTENAAKAKADESSYAFEATGSVLEGCYQGVLSPYRLVVVRAGKTTLSGPYQIIQVTHTLTRSNYSQSFSLRRDASSFSPAVGSGKDPANLIGSIF